MHRNKLESFSFFALFAAVTVLLFYVLSPFIQILALAAVLAALLHRPYEDLSRDMWGLKTIPAIIIVTLVLVLVILPLFLLGSEIFHEAQSLYVQAQGNGVNYIQTIQTAIQHPIQRVFPEFTFNIAASIGGALSFISGNLASIVSQTFFLTLETFLMLLAFFFFLRDGRSLLAGITASSPLGSTETHEILGSMYQTIQSVIKGTLMVALIRWILIGIGFYFFHIPNAILWGSVGGIVGAIPGLGTPFVFIPAVAYLYVAGNVAGAIGLAIFGCIVMVIVDNLLTPYFFGKSLPVPSVFVLFSILGGIIFFGPLGFILGPLVLSVFLSVFRIYSAKASDEQNATA